RKASEAMRAAWLESEYDKKDILQAYLNTSTSGTWTGSACTASARRRASTSAGPPRSSRWPRRRRWRR
ncbi:MAG: transglycosylase domain-containing protein, partial [Acidobacteria bacterium]|nr:transglycosylase domain-containing protein [Acidobacteriota bacterium]